MVPGGGAASLQMHWGRSGGRERRTKFAQRALLPRPLQKRRTAAAASDSGGKEEGRRRRPPFLSPSKSGWAALQKRSEGGNRRISSTLPFGRVNDVTGTGVGEFLSPSSSSSFKLYFGKAHLPCRPIRAGPSAADRRARPSPNRGGGGGGGGCGLAAPRSSPSSHFAPL